MKSGDKPGNFALHTNKRKEKIFKAICCGRYSFGEGVNFKICHLDHDTEGICG